MHALLTLLKEKRHGLVAFTVVVAAFFLLFSVRTGSREIAPLHSTVLEVMAPLQRLFSSPIQALHDAQEHVGDLMQLDHDNRAYQKELAKLRPLGIRNRELERENSRLRKLLGMPEDPRYRHMTARVVGDSSSAFARSYLLAAGTHHGVTQDTPVTVAEGVVGRAVRVGVNSSLVLSLLDLNSRVPVLVERSRTRGIAAGRNDGSLGLEFVPKQADIRSGDLLITSGLGGIFPKGLRVGRVVGITADGQGLFQRIILQPAVDFDRIEEVRLLLPLESPLSPAVITGSGFSLTADTHSADLQPARDKALHPVATP
ncbi:MAG: rod shape-determining protein MreC [Magnetococcales bacterium]|nr:rod shape-determining protein MreC [Magnetococcales bacterium]